MKKYIKSILSDYFPKFTTYVLFYHNFKRFPDFKSFPTINDKLQYLKLYKYNNNSLITTCADKYRVRNYIINKGYDFLLPKLYVGGIKPDDIANYWKEFPNSIVIKCNHGCGYNLLIKNINDYELNKVVKQLNTWINEDYWKYYCELQYKNIKKCVLVEEYLGDNIETYKFYCFNGEPHFFYISSNGEDGYKDLYLDYYDINFNHLDIELSGHQHKKTIIKKPELFDDMVKIAKDLSRDFPFVRVDLYYANNKIYFSELTFIPTGGLMKIEPEKYLIEWGKYLSIEK